MSAAGCRLCKPSSREARLQAPPCCCAVQGCWTFFQPFSTLLQDPRVDCCVYFIAPHRLKPVDVEFMKEISKVGRCMPCVALKPPAEQCFSGMAGNLSRFLVTLWAAQHRQLHGPSTCRF